MGGGIFWIPVPKFLKLLNSALSLTYVLVLTTLLKLINIFEQLDNII